MSAAPSARAEIRLRVLNSLPTRHREHFFAEMRALCLRHIAAAGSKMSDRQSEALELFSEVMAKLLGATTFRQAEADADGELSVDTAGAPRASTDFDWAIDPSDPKRDGRIAWLIDEVGGARALAHRYEDMRRQRFGRWQESGYRTVQISSLQEDTESPVDEGQALARVADASVELHSDPEQSRVLDETRQAWAGLLICAQTQFAPDDDVAMLLNLLAHDDDVQAEFGSEWPVAQIVIALNVARPVRRWDDHRVENAKKRLRNWIGRLKRDYGFGITDVMALFVRCARIGRAIGVPLPPASAKR